MRLIDTNRYYLQGTNNRFVHVATVSDNFREFISFFDRLDRKLYIEEMTGGSLIFIEDDSLAKEISDFLFDKNVTNLAYGDFTVDLKG